MNYSACGLRVGDHFELSPDGVTTPEGTGFCYFAVANVMAAVLGHLDAPEPDRYLRSRPLIACPDPPEALHIRVDVLDDTPGANA
jgi:uncharacterized repeat protein (TIGR04076 family)